MAALSRRAGLAHRRRAVTKMVTDLVTTTTKRPPELSSGGRFAW